LDRGALATAEAMLERARALSAKLDNSELRAHIDDTLLHVLSEAGQQERVFEFGQQLLAALGRDTTAAARLADIHLTIAQAAVAAARLTEASEHLTQARSLDREHALEARIDALGARIALDERRIEDAERLAHSALAVAERLGHVSVACEALVVIGRLARGKDLDRAEDAFQRAHNLAEAHGLTVWRSRALHELGTIDLFRDASPRRLLEARALALDTGALVTAAYVEGELSALYNMQFDLERSLEAARAALQAARRYRLGGVEAMALVFEAEVHAYHRDRTSMERCLAEMAAVAGSDLFFPTAAWECRALCSLGEEQRARAVRELESAIERARLLPLAAPMPAYGLWVLFRGLHNLDAASALEEVRGSWAMMHPATRGLLEYAEAIQLGRAGQHVQAAAAIATGDAVLALTPWFFHMGRRILAEAAITDGWGEPALWLRQSSAFFDKHGYEAIASACASLLRKTGAATSLRRSHLEVPKPFRGQGVTEREMEVLIILVEGLSNKDIGARLYLSPKTVEKHVASLMDKLEVRTRVQLAALATAKMGDRAGGRWGTSSM
jgi:DNA-binding CsgD family transcriptional regulator/tetratricopeptide (TPR) repeat protein